MTSRERSRPLLTGNSTSLMVRCSPRTMAGANPQVIGRRPRTTRRRQRNLQVAVIRSPGELTWWFSMGAAALGSRGSRLATPSTENSRQGQRAASTSRWRDVLFPIRSGRERLQ